ncbi:hypothetical protein SOP90_07300 [Bacillus sp. DAG6]|nr:hypothetical protein [Bacillus sp. DAG6]MEB2640266.1 hypothetical protein [Bacillus sp. DAG6]
MTEAITERYLKLSHLIDIALIKEIMNEELQRSHKPQRNKHKKFVSKI